FAQLFGLRHGRARVLAALLELSDLFRGLVALRLAGFRFGDGLPPLRIQFAEVLQDGRGFHAALPQLFLHQRQIVSDKVQIEHGNSILYRKNGGKCTLALRPSCPTRESPTRLCRTKEARVSLPSCSLL